MPRKKIPEEIEAIVIRRFVEWLRRNGYHICKRWEEKRKVTVYSPQCTYKNDEGILFYKLFKGEMKVNKYGMLLPLGHGPHKEEKNEKDS